MLRIHRHRDELDRVQQVSPWVYRIANNAIIDYYRRPARERPVGAEVEPAGPADLPWPPDVDSADVRAELAGCLRPMLDRLPDKHRQAIMLTEFAGVTQTAAAAQLELSVSGMKTRVQRARRQLKDIVLDCCHVDLDSRGAVTNFYSRDPTCRHCAPELGAGTGNAAPDRTTPQTAQPCTDGAVC
jgi:RNA polymerase sigma-70 factor (ECF subfamily)